MLHFDCPHCGKAIRLKEEFAGKRGSCPHCRKPMQAPAASAPPPPHRSGGGAKSSHRVPAAHVPDPDSMQEPEFFEEVEEAVAAPRGQQLAAKKKKSNSMPLIIGGAVVAGALVVAIVGWLVMGGTNKDQKKGTPAASTQQPVSPQASPASPPSTAPPSVKSSQPAAPATGTRADLFAYLPDGMDAIAGIRVAESLKTDDKVLARAQIESTLRPVLSQSGIGLNQVDEVVMGTGKQLDDLFLGIRATQPIDAAAVRKNLGCSASPEKVRQFDLYALPREADSTESVACFPDPRTLLLGKKELVQKSLEAVTGSQPAGVMKAVTQQAGVQTHLWVVAPMGMLKSQVAQLANLGVSETVFMAPALDKIGQVALGFDLSRAMQLRVAVDCSSENDARMVRVAIDAMRQAIAEAEKKMASSRGDSSGGSDGSDPGGSGPGRGQRSGPGGMQGPPGAPPGGRSGGSGARPPGPGGPSGGPTGQPGMPGGPGGSNTDRTPGAVWNATEVKQSGTQVIVTLPPVKVEGDSAASPLDLFGSATQASFARTAVGSPLFPGPLRRSSTALRNLSQKDAAIPAGTVVLEKYKRPIQRVSWLATLLPYLGHQELHDQINFSETWSDKQNLPAAFTIVEAFLDPLVPKRRWQGSPFEGVSLSHFVGMGGVGPEAPRLGKDDPRAGIFGYDRKTAMAEVRDGVSNTILLIQARDVFGPWIQGGGATVRAAQSAPHIGVAGGFGSPGDAGAMTIFADGSVRFLSKDIDPKVFEALCTINGGESVDPTKFASKEKL